MARAMERGGEAGVRPVWWLAGALALAALAALIVFLLTRGGGSQQARRLPPIATPAALAAFVRGDVRQINGDRVELSLGQSARTITLSSGTRVEALTPAGPDAVAPGDFVSVGGAPNLVNTVAV